MSRAWPLEYQFHRKPLNEKSCFRIISKEPWQLRPSSCHGMAQQNFPGCEFEQRVGTLRARPGPDRALRRSLCFAPHSRTRKSGTLHRLFCRSFRWTYDLQRHTGRQNDVLHQMRGGGRVVAPQTHPKELKKRPGWYGATQYYSRNKRKDGYLYDEVLRNDYNDL